MRRTFRFPTVLLLVLLQTAMSASAAVVVKTGEKVAFLGDSITAQGWSSPHGYVRLVAAGLECNGVRIVPVPAGVGGHTSKDMLARLTRDVLDKKPHWVMISCGMNDVLRLSLDEFTVNMGDIVGQCQAAGIKVAIFTTTTGRQHLEEYRPVVARSGNGEEVHARGLVPGVRRGRQDIHSVARPDL